MKKYFAVLAMFSIFAFNLAAMAAAPLSTPESVTRAFYTWFIKHLADDDVYPLMDKSISRYVAPSTVDVLRSDYKANRFAEGAEYFTNVQDFDEKDWTDHMLVRPAMMLDDVALVAVTFGLASTRKTNVVFLRKINGVWKITKVVDTSDYR
ncbi:hypothetical protein CI15_34555 [Paraburkholderia monticola]|jgi:hypothetical protein|uniref:DUF3828 domain-containing protein n=1 Tax=Paraburkholderia monticola TaxID=1399968 RepID=A0A149PC97_9BURK|nr:DUF3828 domain-containing protein [Paraburkholderia monticola]KXU82633.1 hypothetical protein CI15_34555 [Paraburkholderia monticola]